MSISQLRAALIGDLADTFSRSSEALLGLGVRVDRYREMAEFMARGDVEPEAIAGTDLILALGSANIGERLMERMPRLRGLVSPVTGIEGFERAAASERAIVIANGQTPENYESMAEATILMILASMYDLPGSIDALRAGWPQGKRIPRRMLRHCRIGLVGFGAIARAVAKRLTGWGVEMVCYMPRPRPLPPDVRAVDLDDLMQTSDVVCVLASLTPESRHMIDERRIGLMKAGALLVNTARGGLVEESALVRAAAEKRIRIALDAFEAEPLPPEAPVRSVVGAILTPHCVGHTNETFAAISQACIDNVTAIIRCTPPPYIANPEVLPRWMARWHDKGATI